MIVRELVALFGIRPDRRGFEQAQQQMKTLENRVQRVGAAFGRLLAAGAIAAPLVKIVQMGSDSVETMNALTLAFDDNRQTVVEWSETYARAAGRSSVNLRQMASSLGQVVRGQGFVGDAAVNMTTKLVEASVDIASAFNVADDRAFGAVRAAITGETESLKRISGILPSVANMNEFVKETGKSFLQLTEQEKSAARFAFIMERLGNNTGDAIRTSDELAGQWKRLTGIGRDIGTSIGLLLNPTIKETGLAVISALEPLRTFFKTLQVDSDSIHIARGLLIAFTAAILALAGPALGELLSVSLPLLVGFTALGLVFDEIFITLQGGDTYLNDFIKLLAKASDESSEMDENLRALLQTVNQALDVFASFAFLLNALLTGNYRDFVQGLSAMGIDFEAWVRGRDRGEGLGAALLSSQAAQVAPALDPTGGVRGIPGPTLPAQFTRAPSGAINQTNTITINVPEGQTAESLFGAVPALERSMESERQALDLLAGSSGGSD